QTDWNTTNLHIIPPVFGIKLNGTELSKIIVCSQAREAIPRIGATYRRFSQADGNELPDYEPKVNAIRIKFIT
ncbi:MAG: hypothetical protein ACE5PV_23390, partial [Candidatus Poribacteria bacterium]